MGRAFLGAVMVFVEDMIFLNCFYCNSNRGIIIVD